MTTILLLFCSNVFMTFAWYGHLKYGHSWPLWKAILVSWLIALLEYCLAVPANRLGFGTFSGFQLKILQEVITLTVFLVFALTYLKERLAWNYVLSFVLLVAAAVVAFAFKPERRVVEWSGGRGSGRIAAGAPAQQGKGQNRRSQHQEETYGVQHRCGALAHSAIHHDRERRVRAYQHQGRVEIRKGHEKRNCTGSQQRGAQVRQQIVRNTPTSRHRD